MRDILMNEEHWDKMQMYFDDKIPFGESLIEKAITLQGEDSKGANRAYSMQFACYMSYINTLYSSGAPLAEIKKLYPKMTELFQKAWDGTSGYVQMVWMLSIGVMMDVDDEYFITLSELVKRDELNDYLIDRLIHYALPSWDNNSSDFVFETPYGRLIAVFEANSKEDAAQLLHIYITNMWYKGHDDMSWYNMHKDKNSLHHGYWSFESGAIAKILNLDDTGWENLQYYPYDLVHYAN